MFYQGYGRAEIDGAALAYYRFERIVEDIAAVREQILSPGVGGRTGRQGLVYPEVQLSARQYHRARLCSGSSIPRVGAGLGASCSPTFSRRKDICNPSIPVKDLSLLLFVCFPVDGVGQDVISLG